MAGLGLIVALALVVLSTRAIASSLGAFKNAIYDRNGSAVANGGTVYRPRLYSTIEMKGGQSISRAAGKVFGTLGVKPENLLAIQKAMLGVVESDPGTGREARIPGIQVAGKTGTAQTYTIRNKVIQRENTTWFTCYAPYERPRYVVTVLVQGGTFGGTACAPIAKQILTKLFAYDQCQHIEVQALDPVVEIFKPAPVAQ
jgi:penicillin-binding protein 2